jgi:hypothetical protein
MKKLTSLERCDSEASDGSGKRCPNRGVRMLVRTKFFSGEKQALWLCQEHYDNGGMKFSPTPVRPMPDEEGESA